ncbi:nucleoside deaminase [Paenibacillus pasadenensis]|uniref:nucleoside deaminase n=1 Tax=Paenibacillus TaxID=44249 RepID=UPI000413AF2E|nr:MULTISPECIES: nucleoside deaminase [Paenibacillus]QGG57715.1 nucleoside deaminase [Paenibacillus sp. B01]
MSDRDHIRYLKRAVEVSEAARESGNTPFGALLVGPDGEILLEQGNIEVTERNCTGHAETTLMERASGLYDKKFLWDCALYTSVEPCAMCSGSIYWGNVGTVVYGISEKRLLELTGDDEQNPTLDLPCREVFAAGQKPVTVIGPFEELDEAIVAVHAGYWT